MTEARKVLKQLIEAGEALAEFEKVLYDEYIAKSEYHAKWADAYEEAKNFLISTEPE